MFGGVGTVSIGDGVMELCSRENGTGRFWGGIVDICMCIWMVLCPYLYSHGNCDCFTWAGDGGSKPFPMQQSYGIGG